METATLIAAIVAAGAALLTSAVTIIAQSSLESRKWVRAQQEQADAARRTAVAELAQALAYCAQAMAWLTWKAKEVPTKVNSEDIASYTADIKQLLPRVVSAHLTAVAVHPRVDEVAKELVQELYDLDSEIGLACLQFEDARTTGIAQLAAAYPPAVSYFDRLHERFAGVLAIQLPLPPSTNRALPSG